MEFTINSRLTPTKWRRRAAFSISLLPYTKWSNISDGAHEVGTSGSSHANWPKLLAAATNWRTSSLAPTKWWSTKQLHMHWSCWEAGDTWEGSQLHYKRVVREGTCCTVKGVISGGGVNAEENLNRLDEHHIAAHLFRKPTRVLTPHGTLVDVFMVDPADLSMKIRRQRLEPYLRRTGFYHASLIKRFEYDNPLISALVERWRPETHTFHLPWGECTITLEDVAMQLGLPVDGQPVSGTLRSWSKFHQRDIWEWCHELLGEVPAGHVGTTKFNIKLKWLRNRLQQMPLDLEDNGLMQYARCYMLYLLGDVLLPDKANNTVHVRYLPLLADFDAICTYSWGSAVLCWLYRAMCLTTDYSVEGMAGCHTLLMSWIYYRLPFLAPNVTTPYSFPLATRYGGQEKKGQNDYAEQRLLRHRLRLDNLHVDDFVWQPYMDPRILSRVLAEFLGHPHGDFYIAVVPLIFFRWIEILNVDRVLRQFGGKQGPPNPPLNIDTFHR
ncbi:uncharacterized protein DS421_15g515400 [Arachis hypogaea]|nr:uncharacterized protein DS421_15g515400 [Arachis hypogaea]